MSEEFELTYEHYAYTLTKAGMTPHPEEVFNTPGGNRMCRVVYAAIAETILERFQEDLQAFEELLVEEAEDGVTCAHCGSPTWIELTDHEQLYHVAQYECEDCGRLFGTPEWAEGEEE